MYNTDIPQEDMTLGVSGANYEGILYLENINLKNPKYTGEDTGYAWENISGYVLLKKK